MPNELKKFKPLPELKLDKEPYMDTLRPEKPTGKLGGALVEPSGRQAKVSAPAPAEEPTKAFGINVPDKGPVGPSIRDKSE